MHVAPSVLVQKGGCITRRATADRARSSSFLVDGMAVDEPWRVAEDGPLRMAEKRNTTGLSTLYNRICVYAILVSYFVVLLCALTRPRGTHVEACARLRSQHTLLDLR
jgi:hypothetical protein